MAERKKGLYARLASRFAHLASGSEEDEETHRAEEDERRARAEGDDEEDEDEEGISAEEKEERKARNERRRARAVDDTNDEDKERKDKEEAKRAAASAARAQERERWASVMSSTDAAGRVPLACSLLADTDMSADKILTALKASPAEGRQSGLAARMANVPQPGIGSGPAAQRPEPNSPQGRVSALTAAYDKAIGRTPAGR